MKAWNKSSLLLTSFSLSWLFLWLFFYLAIRPMTSLSPPSPVAPHQHQLHPSVSVPVRDRGGSYVPASTLSSHSVFP